MLRGSFLMVWCIFVQVHFWQDAPDSTSDVHTISLLCKYIFVRNAYLYLCTSTFLVICISFHSCAVPSLVMCFSFHFVQVQCCEWRVRIFIEAMRGGGLKLSSCAWCICMFDSWCLILTSLDLQCGRTVCEATVEIWTARVQMDWHVW